MKFKQIDISKIKANPNNPRGIVIAKRDKKLPLLKDSIRDFGILVPLVVASKNGDYLLIDGERRYVAAQELGLKKAPAYINEDQLTNKNLLYQMFHIHHNREQWGPIQQCNALEIPYNKIKNNKEVKAIENDEAQMRAIAEKLSCETGIELATALTRIYFLRWPDHIKQKLYDNPTEDYWYICEIEGKIIIPALRNYPEYFKKVPADEVREDLFMKLEKHTVKRATEVREVGILTRGNMTNTSDRNKVKTIFKQLHKNKEMTYTEAKDEFIRQFPDYHKTSITPRKISNELKKLACTLQNFEVDKMSEYKGRAKVSEETIINDAGEALVLIEELIEELEGEKE